MNEKPTFKEIHHTAALRCSHIIYGTWQEGGFGHLNRYIVLVSAGLIYYFFTNFEFIWEILLKYNKICGNIIKLVYQSHILTKDEEKKKAKVTTSFLSKGGYVYEEME